MSSTTNVQNYLSNVFRPVSVFDTSTSQFLVRLNMSNINELYVNTLQAGSINIGDQYGNLYLGSNSGNASTTPRGSSNNVAYGPYAGANNQNIVNSVFVGYAAAPNVSNASNVIAIGAGTKAGGSKVIYLGTNTGALTGSNNIFIGNNVNPTPVSNRLLIGHDISGQDLSTNVLIGGDLSNNYIGLLTGNPTHPIELGNYTYVVNGLGINADPRDHTLNVNGDFNVENGFGYLTFDNDANSNIVVSIGSILPGKTANVNICGSVYVDGTIFLSGQLAYPSVLGETVTATNTLDVANGTAYIKDLYGSNGYFNYLTSLGNFDVCGISHFASNVTMSQSLTVLGALNVSGGLKAKSIDVSGSGTFLNVTVSNLLDTSGLSVVSNASIGGNLTVTGTANIGSITFSNLALPGTLSASGITVFGSNVRMNGPLSVSGIGTFGSNVNISGTLNTTGLTTLQALNVSGTLRASSNIILTGATLNASQTTFLTNKINALSDVSINGNLYANSNLVVASNFTLTSATLLDVSQGTVSSSNLRSVFGTISSDLSVGGNLYATGAITAAGGITIPGGSMLFPITTIQVPAASNADTLYFNNLSGVTVYSNWAFAQNGVISGTSSGADLVVTSKTNAGSSNLETIRMARDTGLVTIGNGVLTTSGTFASAVSVSGLLTARTQFIVGDTSQGYFTSNAPVVIRSGAPFSSGVNNQFSRKIQIQDLSGATAYTTWHLMTDTAIGSGPGNLGGNLVLWPYGTTGSQIGSNPALRIYRSSGLAELNYGVNISGNATIGGLLTVSGATTFSSNTYTSGNAAYGSTLSVSGITTLNSNITVRGATALGSTLSVSGLSAMYSDLTVSANLFISNGINVYGSTILYGTLTVSDVARFGSSLNVSGGTNLYSNVYMAGNVACGTTLTASGIVTFYSNTRLQGAVSLGSTLSVSGISTMFSNLTVSGLVSARTLTVSGTTSLYSNVGIGKASTTNALDVSGTTLINGTFITTNAATIGTDLYVTNTSYLCNTQFSASVPASNAFSEHYNLTDVSGFSSYSLWGVGTYNGPLTATSNGDFAIVRKNTAGTVLGRPLTIARSSGFVGIGKDATSALDVSGNINGTGLMNICGTIYTTDLAVGSNLYVTGNSIVSAVQYFKPLGSANTFTTYQTFSANDLSGTYNLWQTGIQMGSNSISSNAEGDFVISRRLTNNTALGWPLTITRKDGFVGLENQAPTARLDVSGTIQATSNLLLGNNYADIRLVTDASATANYMDVCSNSLFAIRSGGTSTALAITPSKRVYIPPTWKLNAPDLTCTTLTRNVLRPNGSLGSNNYILTLPSPQELIDYRIVNQNFSGGGDLQIYLTPSATIATGTYGWDAYEGCRIRVHHTGFSDNIRVITVSADGSTTFANTQMSPGQLISVLVVQKLYPYTSSNALSANPTFAASPAVLLPTYSLGT